MWLQAVIKIAASSERHRYYMYAAGKSSFESWQYALNEWNYWVGRAHGKSAT